jgi:hypothetical protein
LYSAYLADAHVVEQLLRAPGDRGLLGLEAPVRKTAPTRPEWRAHVAADHHVLERRHLGEQPDVLEGARDAGLGHLVHRGRGVGLAAELEAAAVGRVQAGDHVEEGGLAGAVGADQAVDLALVDGDADVRQGLQAAEALVDALAPRDDVAHAHRGSSFGRVGSGAALPCSGGHRPRGRIQHDQRSSPARSAAWRRIAASSSAVGHLLQRAGDVAQHLGQRRQQHRAEDHARNVADAAEHHHRDDHDRSIRLKLSGETKPWKAANIAPDTPPKVAPMPKASSFMLRVLMPIALAAISSSRIAIQARPMRALQPVADHHADHHQQQEQVVVQRDRRDLEAADVAASCPGPAAEAHRVDVADALRAVGDVDRRFRLFMNIRMISPKPSVTMAR